MKSAIVFMVLLGTHHLWARPVLFTDLDLGSLPVSLLDVEAPGPKDKSSESSESTPGGGPLAASWKPATPNTGSTSQDQPAPGMQAKQPRRRQSLFINALVTKLSPRAEEPPGDPCEKWKPGLENLDALEMGLRSTTNEVANKHIGNLIEDTDVPVLCYVKGASTRSMSWMIGDQPVVGAVQNSADTMPAESVLTLHVTRDLNNVVVKCQAELCSGDIFIASTTLHVMGSPTLAEPSANLTSTLDDNRNDNSSSFEQTTTPGGPPVRKTRRGDWVEFWRTFMTLGTSIGIMLGACWVVSHFSARDWSSRCYFARARTRRPRGQWPQPEEIIDLAEHIRQTYQVHPQVEMSSLPSISHASESETESPHKVLVYVPCKTQHSPQAGSSIGCSGDFDILNLPLHNRDSSPSASHSGFIRTSPISPQPLFPGGSFSTLPRTSSKTKSTVPKENSLTHQSLTDFRAYHDRHDNNPQTSPTIKHEATTDNVPVASALLQRVKFQGYVRPHDTDANIWPMERFVNNAHAFDSKQSEDTAVGGPSASYIEKDATADAADTKQSQDTATTGFPLTTSSRSRSQETTRPYTTNFPRPSPTTPGFQDPYGHNPRSPDKRKDEKRANTSSSISFNPANLIGGNFRYMETVRNTAHRSIEEFIVPITRPIIEPIKRMPALIGAVAHPNQSPPPARTDQQRGFNQAGPSGLQSTRTRKDNRKKRKLMIDSY